jgi:hypothetical protein
MDPIRVDTRYTTAAAPQDTGYTPAVTVAQVVLAIGVIGALDTGYTTGATGPLDTRLTIAPIVADTGYGAEPAPPAGDFLVTADGDIFTTTDGDSLVWV